MPTLEDIRTARPNLGPSVGNTPCRLSHALARRGAENVFLKFESLHPTGSFKERGAANKLARLDEADRARGVITASAGNHAQAVAYHATRLGIRGR